MLLYAFITKDGILHKVPTDKNKRPLTPMALCNQNLLWCEVVEYNDGDVLCENCLDRLVWYESWYESLDDEVRELLFFV